VKQRELEEPNSVIDGNFAAIYLALSTTWIKLFINHFIDKRLDQLPVL
jgi:hypothetical protein